MAGGEHELFRVCEAGLGITYKDLIDPDGIINLEDIALCSDYLNIKAENERRYHEANKPK